MNSITQFFLVSSEICLTSPSEHGYVTELLQKKLGINPLNSWCCHSTPEVGAPVLAEVFIGDRYKYAVDTAYRIKHFMCISIETMKEIHSPCLR